MWVIVGDSLLKDMGMDRTPTWVKEMDMGKVRTELGRFKISRGVPPPPTGGNGSRLVYPFALMVPGDSVDVPMKSPLDADRVRANLTYRHRTHQERYATRTVFEGGARVLRVWKLDPKGKA
jgi:hypothetical protein